MSETRAPSFEGNQQQQEWTVITEQQQQQRTPEEIDKAIAELLKPYFEAKVRKT